VHDIHESRLRWKHPRPTLRAALALFVGLAACRAPDGSTGSTDAPTADTTAPNRIDADVEPTETSDAAHDAGELDSRDTPADRDRSIDDIAICEPSLREFFDMGSWNAPAADSENYDAPSPDERRALADSITAGLSGDAERARTRAVAAQYVICRDPNRTALLWRPRQPSGGGARLAVRHGPENAPLIVEVPHPFFEFDTLAEGLEVFERAGARALLVSGTHRCANVASSGCDGRTAVCSSSREPYRESDPAHTTESSFHVMHRATTELFEQSLALSLHGFGDAGISISNGTTGPATAESPVARLGDSLRDEFSDTTITYCNDIPNRTREERFCGTTNIQGRHLNGASPACTEAASEATGRFIHLEQSREIRREFDRVASAVADFTETLP